MSSKKKGKTKKTTAPPNSEVVFEIDEPVKKKPKQPVVHNNNKQHNTANQDVANNKSGLRSDFIPALPPDVIKYIFDFAGFKCLLRCATICRSWRDALRGDWIWQWRAEQEGIPVQPEPKLATSCFYQYLKERKALWNWSRDASSCKKHRQKLQTSEDWLPVYSSKPEEHPFIATDCKNNWIAISDFNGVRGFDMSTGQLVWNFVHIGVHCKVSCFHGLLATLRKEECQINVWAMPDKKLLGSSVVCAPLQALIATQKPIGIQLLSSFALAVLFPQQVLLWNFTVNTISKARHLQQPREYFTMLPNGLRRAIATTTDGIFLCAPFWCLPLVKSSCFGLACSGDLVAYGEITEDPIYRFSGNALRVSIFDTEHSRNSISFHLGPNSTNDHYAVCFGGYSKLVCYTFSGFKEKLLVWDIDSSLFTKL